MQENVLEIKNLHVQFPIHIGTVRAVEDVSLNLRKGEVMGLVGESGCGKSTLGFSILRLLRPPGKIAGGEINYHGRDICRMHIKELLALRGRNISMIFQDPLTSLDPLYTIGEQFLETLRTHEKGIKKKIALERAAEMLKSLGISPDRLHEYPHQMSGGMRQRVMIAMALSCNPQLLIADEPTTALDVKVQKNIIQLIKKLRDKYGMGVLFISHDLGVVAQISDEVLVMNNGKIVESGSVKQVLSSVFSQSRSIWGL